MSKPTDLDAVQKLCDAALRVCDSVARSAIARLIHILVPQMAAEIRELRAELAAEREKLAMATQFNVGPDRWSGVEVIDVYGTGWAVWDRRKAWDSHHGGNFATREEALAHARRLAAGGEESGK